jgi:hypothetical protein
MCFIFMLQSSWSLTTPSQTPTRLPPTRSGVSKPVKVMFGLVCWGWRVRPPWAGGLTAGEGCLPGDLFLCYEKV